MALQEIIGGAGAVGGFLQGRSAANAQKEASRRQAQYIQRQGQIFAEAQPFYGQALRMQASRAGLLGPGFQQTGEGRFRLGSNWGDEAAQLRFQAAEEDINRAARQRENQLRAMYARLGIAEGTQAAGLARNAAGAQQQLGRFRRELAIDAERERERQMQQLQQLIAMGFGQGSQAAQGYGQQAGMYGQQAQSAFGDAGNIINQYMYQRDLGRYMNPPVAPPTAMLGGGVQYQTPPPEWWSAMGYAR